MHGERQRSSRRIETPVGMAVTTACIIWSGDDGTDRRNRTEPSSLRETREKTLECNAGFTEEPDEMDRPLGKDRCRNTSREPRKETVMAVDRKLRKETYNEQFGDNVPDSHSREQGGEQIQPVCRHLIIGFIYVSENVWPVLVFQYPTNRCCSLSASSTSCW